MPGEVPQLVGEASEVVHFLEVSEGPCGLGPGLRFLGEAPRGLSYSLQSCAINSSRVMMQLS